MQKIIIVDAGKDRRQALKMLINLQPALQCEEDFPSCAELLPTLPQTGPSALIMDANLPDLDPGVISHIRLQYPWIAIIIQYTFEEEDKIIEAIQAGAHGYILKKMTGDQLIESIRATGQGIPTLTRQVASALLKEFRSTYSGIISPDLQLLAEERYVLEYLSKGYSQSSAEYQLGMPRETVGDHIRKIFQKLYLATRPGPSASAGEVY